MEGSEMNSNNNRGLKLTEEEAYALLSLCITSPVAVDETAQIAILKLAEYCSQRSEPSNHTNIHLTPAVI
jgi:hypothetical protein